MTTEEDKIEEIKELYKEFEDFENVIFHLNMDHKLSDEILIGLFIVKKMQDENAKEHLQK